MRFKIILGLLTVACACSSSSSPPVVPASDAGDGGGGSEDAGGPAACVSTTPQTTNAGSCTQYNLPPDGGDGGAPPIFCTDYTGSSLTLATTPVSCKATVTDFSMSPCATVNAGNTAVGYCLKACGTPDETVQYYYAGATVGQSQCEALNFTWVAK